MEDPSGTLFYGDNLDVLRGHFPDDSVDLIYLDPPFNSDATYNVLFKDETGLAPTSQIEAFDDYWHWGPESERAVQGLLGPNSLAPAAGSLLNALISAFGRNQLTAYLAMMGIRLAELKRVLRPEGSIYIHCDPTASHGLKLLMDAVFGAAAFKNELIWKRTSAHSGGRQYGRVHDVIFYYALGDPSRWHQQYQPLDEDYVRRHYTGEDERGRYRRSDLTADGVRSGDSGRPWRRFDPTSTGRHWAVPTRDRIPSWVVLPDDYEARSTQERLDLLDTAGMIAWPEREGGRPRWKGYLSESQGREVDDLILDIPPIAANSDERLGWDTQKPQALLERLIASSSAADDLILDPFCGCGTAIDAAQRLGRRWTGIDITHLAIGLIEERLRRIDVRPNRVVGVPRDLESAADLAEQRSRLQFESWAVSCIPGFQPNARQVHDRGIDGRMVFERTPETAQRSMDYGLAVAQVKSGRAGAPDIQQFKGAMVEHQADIGIFVVMRRENRTRPMVRDAAAEGNVTIGRTEYPRLQVWSIEEYFEGLLPRLPEPLSLRRRRFSSL